jgi:hypothetical protein
VLVKKERFNSVEKARNKFRPRWTRDDLSALTLAGSEGGDDEALRPDPPKLPIRGVCLSNKNRHPIERHNATRKLSFHSRRILIVHSSYPFPTAISSPVLRPDLSSSAFRHSRFGLSHPLISSLDAAFPISCRNAVLALHRRADVT